MYNGLPVVGSDVPGITNLIQPGRNGLIFNKDDPRELGEKVKMLLKNPDQAAELGRHAQESLGRVPDFEDVVAEHLEIYSQVSGAM